MMPPSTTYTGVAGLNRALRKLPRNVTIELRARAGVIAARVAGLAAGRAQAAGGVAALVAPTIRVRRDRVPVVMMGSAAKLPPRNGRTRSGKRQTVGDIVYGAEFGAGPSLGQFRPWMGNDEDAGYFLYPTLRAEADTIQAEYSDALGDALKDTK